MDWTDFSELLPVLGPIGGLLALLLGIEGIIKWRKRRRRTSIKWASRPIKVEVPTTREVKAHDAKVDEIKDLADKAGPHTETDPADVTDEEIDGWARGD